MKWAKEVVSSDDSVQNFKFQDKFSVSESSNRKSKELYLMKYYLKPYLLKAFSKSEIMKQKQ